MEKSKIWDVQNKQWFKPVYPGFKKDNNSKIVTGKETREIVFSQAGDMFLHTSTEGGETKLTFVDHTQFISCLYSGIKDKNEKKLYVGDVASNGVAKWEVIFNRGCYCGKIIGSTEDQETHIALRAIVDLEYIGNILETPELIA